MQVITIHYAKTNLSRLIKKVSAGEEVIIARGDKPLARLVAFRESKRKRLRGSLKGTLHVGPEFFRPLPPQEFIVRESFRVLS